DMALRGFFAHVTPDGVDPWQRLARGGVGYSTAGENIAHGITSGRQAYRLWMDSEPHRRNIENCAFTHHGVASFEGRWTHVFIRPH
ncbi:MAG TPA: CAP domain-containing protein, partial [Longimicrobiaceae bacterium]|nr:CAP domain-containing protein [Longimicrobiaceae bacterium]